MTWDIQPLSTAFELFVTTFTATAAFTNWTPTSTYSYVSVRGTKLEVRVDGIASMGGTATDDISAPGEYVQLGGVNDLQLLEVIAVKGPLSDGDLASTQMYISNKFGL
jgi:hypothetical protein